MPSTWQTYWNEKGSARVLRIEPPLRLSKQTAMTLALGEHVLLITVDAFVEDREEKPPCSLLGNGITRFAGVL
jgi:hypothetical protein